MDINRIDPGKQTTGVQPSKTTAANLLHRQSFQEVLSRIQEKSTSPVNFSKHAQVRLDQRSVEVDMQRLSQAVEMAREKGIKDTLVLMGNSAFIVNVPSNMVITAMNKDEMQGKVFTNIDGAVIS